MPHPTAAKDGVNPTKIDTREYAWSKDPDSVLIIEEVTGSRRRWELRPGASLTVGRASSSDIVISDPRVPRNQAVIGCDLSGRASIENVSKLDIPLTVDRDVLKPQSGTRYWLDDSASIQIVGHEFRVFYVDQSMPTRKPVPRVAEDYEVSVISVEVSLTHDVPVPARTRAEKDLLQILLSRVYEVMLATLASGFDLKAILHAATDTIFRSTPADRVLLLLAESDKAVTRN